jgi:hypothetical protein
MPAAYSAAGPGGDDLEGNRRTPRGRASLPRPRSRGTEGAEPMTTVPTPGLLRTILLADVAMSGASGVTLAAAPAVIASATALPAWLLMACGVFLLPYAALLAWCARQQALARRLVWVLAGGNLLWAVACAALPLSGLVAPNGWGVAFLAAQAVAVAVFAEFYIVALRRAPRVA